GAVTPGAPRCGRGATGGRRIRGMSGDLAPAGPTEHAEYLTGRARWAALAVFAVVTAAGASWLNPSAPVAVAGAVVAVGAAVPLGLGWGPGAGRAPGPAGRGAVARPRKAGDAGG